MGVKMGAQVQATRLSVTRRKLAAEGGLCRDRCAQGEPVGDSHRGWGRRAARGSCWDSWRGALRSQPGQVRWGWPQPQHRFCTESRVWIQPPLRRCRTSQRIPPPSRGSWGRGELQGRERSRWGGELNSWLKQRPWLPHSPVKTVLGLVFP